MAGRQFGFFIGPSDQAPLERALRASGDVAFLNERPSSHVPEELTSSIITRFGEEPFKILIARRADLPLIEFRRIQGRADYSCDQDISPIVSFSRFPNVVDGRLIRASRLYRIDKYWGYDGNIVTKSPEFVGWGERLYRLAKKSLAKVEQGCFAGTEALDLRASGIAFEGLDIPTGSIDG
jgi:hypothetical protein